MGVMSSSQSAPASAAIAMAPQVDGRHATQMVGMQVRLEGVRNVKRTIHTLSGCVQDLLSYIHHSS